MDAREFLPRKVVRMADFAAEFPDEPQVWTVDHAWRYTPPDDPEPKLAIKFKEYPLSVVLNTTRGDAIFPRWGTDTDYWPGRKLQLTHQPCTVGRDQKVTIVFTILDNTPDEPTKKGPKKSWRPDQGGEG